MADGVAITPGVGTTIATDLVGGYHYQRIKVTFGDDGFATDVSATNPLPVTISGDITGGGLTDTELRASPIPVSGAFYQATQPVSIATLPALAAGGNVIGGVTQSGTWSVGVTGSVAVTGTFWQATQPVSLASLPALATGSNTIGKVNIADAIVTTVGRLAATGSRPVVLSNEDLTALQNIKSSVDAVNTTLSTTGITPGTVDSPSPDVMTVQPPSVKFAKIAASASGDNTLVSAVAGKKIRVISYTLMGAGAVNAKFQSSTTSDLTGLKYIAAAGGGLVANFNPAGWFETVAGEGLHLNLSAAIAVGGELSYHEV